MAGTAVKGVFASITFASVVWAALAFAAPPEPVVTKQSAAPPLGVIGEENRVRLNDFTPDLPELFPGWDHVQNAAMRIVCNGGDTGSGVLIGDGTRMISAGHVFLENDGSVNDWRRDCLAYHASGDGVRVTLTGMKSGGFQVPEALGTHFSVGISARDWVIVRLSRVPMGAQPLPLASREALDLRDGVRVLNISGSHDNFQVNGFLAQVCTYHGVPPTASELRADGQIVGRLAEPGDEWRVARYDCDLGLGGSGSPIIGWHDGAPHLWGILTDSLRGATRCPQVQRASCYSAGPLVTTMDIVE